jgi:hypothetical protein
MTAPPADHEKILASWCRRLDRIRRQLLMGHLHHSIWTSMRDEIQRLGSEQDLTFLRSYMTMYVEGEVMLVRRVADTQDDSHSLFTLIDAIQANPGVMTRSRYVKRWAETGLIEGEAAGEREWDSLFAQQPGDEAIDPDLLERDKATIKDKLNHLVDWATTTVAHLDPRAPTKVPRYSDIPEALDLLAEITDRYGILLVGSSMSEWTPVVPGDWQEIFRPALFPID